MNLVTLVLILTTITIDQLFRKTFSFMKSNIQEVKTINVRLISDKPVRKTPYQVKGVIMKEHPGSDITPMLNGNYREKFLYPRVQVKILNEEIYLIGIAEGVDPIKSILPIRFVLSYLFPL